MKNPDIRVYRGARNQLKTVMNASNSTEVNSFSFMMVFSFHLDSLP